MRRIWCGAWTAAIVTLILASGVQGHAQTRAGGTMTVVVDERHAPQRLTFVHEELPVVAGPLSLAYPKWIPGEHGPSGPIQQVGMIRVSADGDTLPWTRDADDIFTIHVDVPRGVSTIAVDFTVVLENTISDRQVLLAWNTTLLYPLDADKTRLMITPSIVLPDGWQQGSSLRVTGQANSRVDFAPLSLERLIDSPVLSGEFFRAVPLTSTWPAELDVTADSAAQLAASDAVQAFKKFGDLVDEDRAMFGFRHWETFHILVSQSDARKYDGLEHEDSPYNAVEGSGLARPDVLQALGSPLLAHEQSHAWVGKYRRPADLYSKPNYQGPERTSLLWVYEGLNNYVGTVLSTRAGFNDAEYARELLAGWIDSFAHQVARTTTPLEDTATASRAIRGPGPWQEFRRTQDYYFEGTLIWLEADAIIRARTNGASTLDTFLTRFFGGRDTGPIVVPYTREDVESALNDVCPYDWHRFFEERVYRANPKPPTAGVEAAGWKLVYTDAPNHSRFPVARVPDGDQAATIGVRVRSDGGITDVVPDSPAYHAGLGPQMKIVAVDGHTFSIAALRDAIAHPNDGIISLVVENYESVGTHDVTYAGGLRYPHLVRVEGTPDYLTRILEPRR